MSNNLENWEMLENLARLEKSGISTTIGNSQGNGEFLSLSDSKRHAFGATHIAGNLVGMLM